MLTETIAQPENTPDSTADLVSQILDQFEPFVARQRRAMVQAGCLRQMSSTQLHVLFLLVGEGAMPMSRLAERLGVSLPNATGLVDRMVEHGYAERGSDADDRRVVTVSATPSGRAAVEEIDVVRRRALASVLERLTPEQQRRALRTFTELRAAAEAVDLAEHDHRHTA